MSVTESCQANQGVDINEGVLDSSRWKDGEPMTKIGPPTKYTLQRIAREAGLPVPELTQDINLAQEWAQSQEVLIRTCLPDAVDNYAIDYLKTIRVFPGDSVSESLTSLRQCFWSRPWVPEYLKRLGYCDNLEPVVFFQKAIKDLGSAILIHVLTMGDYFVVNLCNPSVKQNVSSVVYRGDGKLLEDENNLLWLSQYREWMVQVRQIVSSVESVYGEAVSGGNFAYHHELIGSVVDGEKRLEQFTVDLVQSRVEYLIDDYPGFEQRYQQLLKGGVREVSFDIGEIGGDDWQRKTGGSPYLLMLVNSHRYYVQEGSTQAADLSKMAGLVLPSRLQGGLLMHGGYTVIADAFRRKIPVVFR